MCWRLIKFNEVATLKGHMGSVTAQITITQLFIKVEQVKSANSWREIAKLKYCVWKKSMPNVHFLV